MCLHPVSVASALALGVTLATIRLRLFPKGSCRAMAMVNAQEAVDKAASINPKAKIDVVGGGEIAVTTAVVNFEGQRAFVEKVSTVSKTLVESARNLLALADEEVQEIAAKLTVEKAGVVHPKVSISVAKTSNKMVAYEARKVKKPICEETFVRALRMEKGIMRNNMPPVMRRMEEFNSGLKHCKAWDGTKGEKEVWNQLYEQTQRNQMINRYLSIQKRARKAAAAVTVIGEAAQA